MILSTRLQTLAKQYQQEEHIWDVGCDHGLLGLSFGEKKEVTEIHLVDPSERVISNLKQAVDSYITKGKVFIHHMKGQEIIPSPSSSLVFIAGMGGKEITDILKSIESRLSEKSRVVISPHRNILELRSFLAKSSYRLENESVVEDEGRFYQVMTLNQKRDCPHVSLYGEKMWFSPEGQAYQDQQLKHFQLHRDPLSEGYCNYLKGLSFSA